MTRSAHAHRSTRGLRLAGLGAAVLALHLLGWGLFLGFASRDPALAGLGALAYTFGLRHAFDADHIAAIDNTTRKLIQDGKRPVGVGFFFSLGHSTVVLGLVTALAVAAGPVDGRLPGLQRYGGVVGTSVSGVFLLVIGLLNLLVLLDIVRMLRDHRHDAAELDERLLDRGAMSRLFLRRIGGRIDASWKIYPVGVLFGLGFDTATEIGLLALAAGVATEHVPLLAVLSLPLLFAAGMSLMDTVDGAFMSHAYGWALSNPARRVYYNLTVTSLSVAVALALGAAELLQVATSSFAVDLSKVGYAVVALFAATWAASAILWRTSSRFGLAEGRRSA